MDLMKWLPDGCGEYRSLLSAAFAMAEKAGGIHMRYFRRDSLEQSTKLNDSDVVTVADREAEASVVGYIHRHYPSHGIIAEESGTDHEERVWRWVIDPLDGTTNFAAGPAGILCVNSAGAERRGGARRGVRALPRRMFLCLEGCRRLAQRQSDTLLFEGPAV